MLDVTYAVYRVTQQSWCGSRHCCGCGARYPSSHVDYCRFRCV